MSRNPIIYRAIPGVGLLLLTLCVYAAEPDYSREVSKWEEITVPPESDRGARNVWSYAANYSNHAWRVFTKDGKPYAQLNNEVLEERRDQPSFTPEADGFRGRFKSVAVDDGWLVGFNRGEFGAALYWFSHNGKGNYKISNHQVVDFFSLKEGIYAIEGLAHLGMSTGSVIRVSRPRPGARWQAASVVKLPFAPYTVSLRRDGTMLIALSDSLVSVSNDLKVQTLLPHAPWGGLYPRSSVLSPDERKLYIGMRQFVAEFDLTKKNLRFLVPSRQFLNKLPIQNEERIRKQ